MAESSFYAGDIEGQIKELADQVGAVPSGKTLQGEVSDINTFLDMLSYDTGSAPTVTLVNCTSDSVNNNIKLSYNDSFIVIKGAYRIRGFARTGGNPGIEITLPVSISTARNYAGCALIKSGASTEYSNGAITKNTSKIKVTTTESVNNTPNGTFIVEFPLFIIKR